MLAPTQSAELQRHREAFVVKMERGAKCNSAEVFVEPEVFVQDVLRKHSDRLGYRWNVKMLHEPSDHLNVALMLDLMARKAAFLRWPFRILLDDITKRLLDQFLQRVAPRLIWLVRHGVTGQAVLRDVERHFSLVRQPIEEQHRSSPANGGTPQAQLKRDVRVRDTVVRLQLA